MKTSILVVMTITAFSVCSIGQAAHVNADGKEWMQVTDSTNISYNTMASNCSTTTGVCTSGSIGGNNLNGWTWANSNDVVSLFDWYIGSEAVTNGGLGLYDKRKKGSTFAPSFLADFDVVSSFPLLFGGTVNQVRGIIRDDLSLYPGSGHAYMASLSDQILITSTDRADISSSTYKTTESATTGHWIYRDVSAVPIPAAAFMFAPALLGFLGFRRKMRA